jgi:hypothetical protein
MHGKIKFNCNGYSLALADYTGAWFILASILNREKSVALWSRTRWIIFIVGNSVIKCSNLYSGKRHKAHYQILDVISFYRFFFRFYNTFLDAGEDIIRNWTKCNLFDHPNIAWREKNLVYNVRWQECL